MNTLHAADCTGHSGLGPVLLLGEHKHANAKLGILDSKLLEVNRARDH